MLGTELKPAESGMGVGGGLEPAPCSLHPLLLPRAKVASGL